MPGNVQKSAASVITCLRVLAAPLFFYVVRHEMFAASIVLWVVACTTDGLDGYVARKTASASNFGAWFDVTADFLFILTAFVAFVQSDIYPWWLLLIIIGMFCQFLLTSKRRRLLYDPIGKYYGAILFVAIGLTLLLNDFGVHYAVLTGIIFLTGASVLSRWLFYFGAPRNHASVSGSSHRIPQSKG